MKTRYILVVWAVVLLITTLFAVVYFANPAEESYTDVFVGIDAAYDAPEEIKTLVDAVSPYTNVFIIGSTGITFNETKLTDLCQYIFDRGLSFIVYTDDHDPPVSPSRTWIENAKGRWGNRFLGLYVYDEVGGKHLDLWTYRVFTEAENYTDARNLFVAHMESLIQLASSNSTSIQGVQTFSSDYALYWFDYKAGYDVLFAEFGWNYSRQLNVALCRGAALVQNRKWGVMITYTYDQEPYLEDHEKLYEDMVFAYENGAEYIMIFDTNPNYTHGILGEQHFQAMKRFTQYAHENPRVEHSAAERTAFVLPKDFAYGFRGPTDKIWGLWEAEEDPLSFELSDRLGSLLDYYGNELDVIYDDQVDYDKLEYDRILFWNGTVLGG